MDESLIILMVLSLFTGAACWLVFLWAVHKGQFSDIERPKYRMLEEEEGPAPPAPEAPEAGWAGSAEIARSTGNAETAEARSSAMKRLPE